MGHPITAIVKTFLDQAIMAPAGIGLFFTAMGMLEGTSAPQVRHRNALYTRLSHKVVNTHAQVHAYVQSRQSVALLGLCLFAPAGT